MSPCDGLNLLGLIWGQIQKSRMRLKNEYILSTVLREKPPAIDTQGTRLEAEITHVELGNLNVLLRVLDQTSQPSLTRQQVPFVLQMFQLIQSTLALCTARRLSGVLGFRLIEGFEFRGGSTGGRFGQHIHIDQDLAFPSISRGQRERNREGVGFWTWGK